MAGCNSWVKLMDASWAAAFIIDVALGVGAVRKIAHDESYQYAKAPVWLLA